MNTNPIQAIVFDLGGVMLDVDLDRGIAHWSAASGLPAEQIAELCRSDTLYRQMERGELSIRRYHNLWADRLGGMMTFGDFLAGWNAILGPVLPGVEALIERLARSLRLACLTNTNAAHAEVWRVSCAGLLRHFEGVFCSHEMGVRKPEPAAFDYVLSHLALPAACVVFIDDRQDNVAAATAAGMRAFQAAGADEIRAGLEEAGVTPCF
jgi:putative hydrolase of the HAD superfamily